MRLLVCICKRNSYSSNSGYSIELNGFLAGLLKEDAATHTGIPDTRSHSPLPSRRSRSPTPSGSTGSPPRTPRSLSAPAPSSPRSRSPPPSSRSRSRKCCYGRTIEKFVILDVVEGFPLRGVNIGQRRASEEVGSTHTACRRGQGPGHAGR